MLAAYVDGGWRPGIGDPSLLGWATVVAYVVACVLCWRAFGRTRRPGGRSNQRPWFWALLGVLLLLLAINKQLDLQSWLTVTARAWAKHSGWYPRHRAVQRAFVIAIAGGGLLGLGVLGWFVRRAAGSVKVALVGAVFLICFVVVRAASFHHVDHLLGVKLGVAKMNVVLEMGGIAWVVVGAALAGPGRRRAPPLAASTAER